MSMHPLELVITLLAFASGATAMLIPLDLDSTLDSLLRTVLLDPSPSAAAPADATLATDAADAATDAAVGTGSDGSAYINTAIGPITESSILEATTTTFHPATLLDPDSLAAKSGLIGWLEETRTTIVSAAGASVTMVETTWSRVIDCCRKTLPSVFGSFAPLDIAPPTTTTTTTNAVNAATVDAAIAAANGLTSAQNLADLSDLTASIEADFVDQVVTYTALLSVALMTIGLTFATIAVFRRMHQFCKTRYTAVATCSSSSSSDDGDDNDGDDGEIRKKIVSKKEDKDTDLEQGLLSDEDLDFSDEAGGAVDGEYCPPYTVATATATTGIAADAATIAAAQV